MIHLGIFNLGERELKGDMIAVYKIKFDFD